MDFKSVFSHSYCSQFTFQSGHIVFKLSLNDDSLKILETHMKTPFFNSEWMVNLHLELMKAPWASIRVKLINNAVNSCLAWKANRNVRCIENKLKKEDFFHIDKNRLNWWCFTTIEVMNMSRYRYRPVTSPLPFWTLRYRPLPFSGQRYPTLLNVTPTLPTVTSRCRILLLLALPIVI